MTSVYTPTWSEKALDALKLYLIHIGNRKEFLIEDFAKWAVDKKILDEPTHSNKWGSFTRSAYRSNLIACFGVGIPKHRKASNGRIVRSWIAY